MQISDLRIVKKCGTINARGPTGKIVGVALALALNGASILMVSHDTDTSPHSEPQSVEADTSALDVETKATTNANCEETEAAGPEVEATAEQDIQPTENV